MTKAGWLLMGACGFLGGCAQPSHLFHVHWTSVGVSLAAGAEGTGGHVGLAYKQEQYFIIPKTKTAVGGQEKIDAVSVIGCSYVVTEGVAGVEFEERLATGDAAIAAAANIDPNSYICTPTQFPVTQQTGQSGGGASGGQQ